MIILHIITRVNKGGTSSWLKTLFELKSSEFNQVIFFGNTLKYEEEDDFYLKYDFKKFKFLKHHFNPINDILTLIQLRKEIIKIQPNIVNTHTFKAGIIGRLACINLKVSPFVIHTFHGHLLYGYFGRFKKNIFIVAEKLLEKVTNHYIVNGNQTVTDLVNLGIGTLNKYTIILPGYKLNKKSTSTVSKKRNADTSKSNFVVGWLGRLVPIKNPFLVLEIAKKMPDVEFVIGGQGILKNVLQNRATNNVKFLGWCEPMFFWEMCDVAVLTSKNEAVPYSLVEAAAFGKPIVAPNIGSISDILTTKNGFFVEDFHDYITALSILKMNKKIFKNMSDSSRQVFKNNFSVKRFIDLHKEIFLNN